MKIERNCQRTHFQFCRLKIRYLRRDVLNLFSVVSSMEVVTSKNAFNDPLFSDHSHESILVVSSTLNLPYFPPLDVTYEWSSLVRLAEKKIEGSFNPIPSRVEGIMEMKNELEATQDLCLDSLLQLACYLSIYDYWVEAYFVHQTIFNQSVKNGYLTNVKKMYIAHDSLLGILQDLCDETVIKILFPGDDVVVDKEVVNAIVEFLVNELYSVEAEEYRLN
jgi:hypothetical protein